MKYFLVFLFCALQLTAQGQIGFGGIRLHDKLQKLDTLHSMGLWDVIYADSSLFEPVSTATLFPKSDITKVIYSQRSSIGLEELFVDMVVIGYDGPHIQSMTIYTESYDTDHLDDMKRGNSMFLVSVANVYGKPNDYVAGDIPAAIYTAIVKAEPVLLYRWIVLNDVDPKLVSIGVFAEALGDGSIRYFAKIESATDGGWNEVVNHFR